MPFLSSRLGLCNALLLVTACHAGPDQEAAGRALSELRCPPSSQPAEFPLWYGRAAGCRKVGGDRQGTWLAFWRNGQLHERGSYCQDVPCGDWERFDPRGRRTESGAYRDGRRQGPWVFFHEASDKERESGAFQAGVRWGMWRHLDRDGRLVGQGEYLAGQRHGDWITFDEDRHRCQGSYQNGVKSGHWICYQGQGGQAKWTEGEYLSGLEDGTWRVWYPNGTLKRQGEYRLGKRHGRWLDYDRAGALIGEYEYRDDRMIRSRRYKP